MAILKRHFLVTVLSRDVDTLEFESLADLERQISDGDHIGDWRQVAGPLVVPDENVQAELLALGNDGSFFDVTDDWTDWPDLTMRAQPHCVECGCDLHEGVCPEGHAQTDEP